MRQHLRFLFKHREILRLKVNAQEDLLLNGARAPTHRGQCVHLLSKVDLSATQSALTRISDPKAKAALLSGVVRFSTDPGILLLYLESLHDVASRQEAAAAFDAAIGRVDFAQLSSARMRRVLDLIAATFTGHERVQALFGLLRNDGFRAAFDACSDALPDALLDLFVPLRAAHETIVLGQPNRHGDAALRTGVRALLDAPVEVLRSFPDAVRERLLESAVQWLDDPELADRATDALLETSPRESRTFSRLAMLRVQELLRRHEDERAEALLEQVRVAHPSFQMPGKWLQALHAPRVARLALWEEDASRRVASRLRPAFWLDAQHSVWVRLGAKEDADAFLRDALLQRQVAGAGVVPVLECGVAEDGTPHAVLPILGRPVEPWLERRGLSDDQIVGLALAGVQVLLSLALAGVKLPDAAAGRFLGVDAEPPMIWIADLSGAQRATPEAAKEAHRALATSWCAALERARREARSPLRPLDDGTGALPDLVRALAARM
jgi:hypothetical protein